MHSNKFNGMVFGMKILLEWKWILEWK